MLQQNDSQQRASSAKTRRGKSVRQRGTNKVTPRELRLLRQQLSEDEYAFLESELIYRQ